MGEFCLMAETEQDRQAPFYKGNDVIRVVCGHTWGGRVVMVVVVVWCLFTHHS
jgi:hypothetical protein